MAESVSVDRLGPPDARRLGDTLESLVPEHERGGPVPPHGYLANLLASPSCYVFLAQRDTDAVGYLCAYRFPRLEHPGEQVYLFDIVVAPDARRSGIGRRLVESLLHVCRSDGVGLVWVGTALENLAAQRTFEAAGGRRISETYVEYHFSLAGSATPGAAVRP